MEKRKNDIYFKTETLCEIGPFLQEKNKEWTKSKIKSLLTHEMVICDNIPIKKWDTKIKKGKTITIRFSKIKNNPKDKRLSIIYEDYEFLAVRKKAGLLSIATKKEKEHTLYHLVSEYVKQVDKKNKIFIVNRIDKDTSGIVLFAKNQSLKLKLQDAWNDYAIKREYYAVVDGKIKEEKGIFQSNLKEEENGMVHSTKEKDGKLAITKYTKLKEKGDWTSLNIELKTGRKNQIRIHLSENNTPILGDKKYGNKKDPFHRLALHNHTLVIKHPTTGKILTFTYEIPKEIKL